MDLTYLQKKELLMALEKQEEDEQTKAEEDRKRMQEGKKVRRSNKEWKGIMVYNPVTKRDMKLTSEHLRETTLAEQREIKTEMEAFVMKFEDIVREQLAVFRNQQKIDHYQRSYLYLLKFLTSKDRFVATSIYFNDKLNRRV